MKKLFLLSLLLAASACFGQNVRFDASFPSISSTTSTPYLVANVPPNSPTLAVCSSPANQVPCTNYATTYNSVGAACSNGAQDTPQPQPSACQPVGDAQGNIGFWAPAGTYDYTVCVSDNCFGPYTVTLGGSNTSPLNTSTSGGGVVSNCIFGWPTGVQFAGTIVASNNQVRYYRCLLTDPVIVGHASTIISTNPAGTMAMGYFSCTAPYPALTRFQVDSSTTGAKTGSQTPVTIPRGCVIFAYSASSSLLCPHTYVAVAAGEVDAITPNFGVASGAVVAGDLPASLGTLTGNTAVPPYIPVVFFEY